jgi:putative transposase
VYQGRFRSFPIQTDEHFLTVCRYVERNPLRAKLVNRAEHWWWSGIGVSQRSAERARELLSAWPAPPPEDWTDAVNEPQTVAEIEALRCSVRRGCPFGEIEWVAHTAKGLGLSATLRPRGRPKKRMASGS